MVQDYVVLDLETTGLSPKSDKIIEIGAIRVRQGMIQDTFSAFVNPGRSLEEKTKELTGIQDKDLAQAPYMEEILMDFLDFVGDDCLLGHNIIFDYSFIKKEAVNKKLHFEKDGIDTLRIARRFLTDLPSKRLGDICEYYQIPITAHRATGDAMATHMLYQRLCDEFYEKEEEMFTPKKLIYNVKKEGPVTLKQIEQLERLCVRYEIGLEEGHLMAPVKNVTNAWLDINHITKNEASRLLDKIKAAMNKKGSLREHEKLL